MNMQELYPVSQAAKLSGTTESLVRYLDKQGFVVPARDASGRRLYTNDDIEAIRQYQERSSARRRA
jgi:DNA-binding transcriptional MerR regulator